VTTAKAAVATCRYQIVTRDGAADFEQFAFAEVSPGTECPVSPCPQRFPMTGGRQPHVPAGSALYGRFGSGDGAHVSLVTYNQVRCGSKRG